MANVIDIGELGEWKPEIQRLPPVEPHAMYLDQIWLGGVTYSVDEIQQHITNLQLAVATQLKRSTESVPNGGGS